MIFKSDSKRVVAVRAYTPLGASLSSSSASSSPSAPPSSSKAGVGKKAAPSYFKLPRLTFVLAFVVVMYCLLGYNMFKSVGQPYRDFLQRAEDEGFDVMEGETVRRAEALHAFNQLNDEKRLDTDKMNSWFAWMSMDIEEFEEAKKKQKQQTVLDSLPKSMRVPSKYAPGFWPALLFGSFAVLHSLYLLMQHWSVPFNCRVNFKPFDMSSLPVDFDGSPEALRSSSGKAAAGTAPALQHLPSTARVTPAAGPDELVPIEVVPGLGMVFEYHRRHYYWSGEDGMWMKIRSRTNMQTKFFSKWRGHVDENKVGMAKVRFGMNLFNVRQPTFIDLYKKQLLSPLCVFQLFSIMLWCLDEYWQYSLFTLFMVLTFEGTVVFSRLKSLGALKGMGNKSRDVLVYRLGKWSVTTTEYLLPGDVLSLKKDKGVSGGDVVPADLVLLRGSAVLSEASLTGESVPQMKEGLLLEEGGEEQLEIKGKHKNHVLYAGTTMLQAKGESAQDPEPDATPPPLQDDSAASASPLSSSSSSSSTTATSTSSSSFSSLSQSKSSQPSGGVSSIPSAPDGGCLCFVLRTGFMSAQGKLVRMIEGSQDKVKGHEIETALLLGMLFIFACASSGYVLKKGMENNDRSKYELLLHCILIITSVIPPELPMQTALAVNNSLMTLMKMQVFCTEPFRVPIAGKIDSCLFDKTGTLTTDELVAVGVFDCAGANNTEGVMTAMSKIDGPAGLVLAGCNSLINVEGETTGDPLESAALKSMRWTVTEKEGDIVPKPATEKREAGKTMKVGADHQNVSKIKVLQRHHFSSKLQRMSAVVSDDKGRHFSVAKGSPEAIGELVTSKPPGYDKLSLALAKKGLRVIALAFRPLATSDVIEAARSSRDSCEKELIFAGFVAFTCRVRKDTRAVLDQLRGGGMSVAMVTGDNLLTAAHVAKEVGICSKDEKILILEKKSEGSSMYWKSYADDTEKFPFVAAEIPNLAKQGYELSTTGKNIDLAYTADPDTTKMLWHFKIFARMSPDAKETVIKHLHTVGHLCLMCGDGANDVGALKQADVGVALLGGFGDVNVDKGEDSAKKKLDGVAAGGAGGANAPTAMMSKQEFEALSALSVKDIKGKIRELGIEPDSLSSLKSGEKADLVAFYRNKCRERAVALHDAKNAADKKKMDAEKSKKTAKEEFEEKQRKMAARVKELEDAGESWAQFKAMKEFWAAEMAEKNKKAAENAKNNTVTGSAAKMAASLDDFEEGEGLPMVKIGDASVAAPFTSKMPSIRSCVDIIRQGRCTLVTSVQMYQILALNCLISSYSLSVLYLDGVKYGDTQMTAMGMLMSVSFMSVSRAKPLDKLSPVRPLTSIFHPSLFLSLLGQFAVHLATMYVAVNAAKEHLPADYKVELDGLFKPGIVNSVVFLVSNVQQVTVFVVNMKGRPFMHGLTENTPLLYSLAATFILTFMFASETMPGLNKYFQLVPFPTNDDGHPFFRNYILGLLAADVFVSLMWDRLMQFIFAPKILFASMEGTTAMDVFKLLRTIAMIGGVMYMFVGNDETWEELMREDERLAAIANGTLIEEVGGVVGGAIKEAVVGSGGAVTM